jgi:hypothetical protein
MHCTNAPIAPSYNVIVSGLKVIVLFLQVASINEHDALLVACLCRQFINDCNVYFVYIGSLWLINYVCMHVCNPIILFDNNNNYGYD